MKESNQEKLRKFRLFYYKRIDSKLFEKNIKLKKDAESFIENASNKVKKENKGTLIFLVLFILSIVIAIIVGKFFIVIIGIILATAISSPLFLGTDSYLETNIMRFKTEINFLIKSQEDKLIQVNQELLKVLELLYIKKNVSSEYNKIQENSFYPSNEIFSSSNLDFLTKEDINKSSFINLIKNRIECRSAVSTGNESFPEIVQLYTIIETDKILIENGINNYSIIQVGRSTNQEIDEGIYFYAINDDDTMIMMKPPYKYHNNLNYIIFDKDAYNNAKKNIIKIKKSDIVKYKLYGTEMMQSTVSTNSNNISSAQNSYSNNNSIDRHDNTPSLPKTLLSQLLFGSSYTILKGVNKMMTQQTNVLGNKLDNIGNELENINNKLDVVVEAINSISITTEHKIIDTRKVQIILKNKRDIEINGVTIYYDLNRVYPNLENNNGNKEKPGQDASASESKKNADYISELKELKILLDEGIITKDEFEQKKKILLNLK